MSRRTLSDTLNVTLVDSDDLTQITGHEREKVALVLGQLVEIGFRIVEEPHVKGSTWTASCHRPYVPTNEVQLKNSGTASSYAVACSSTFIRRSPTLSSRACSARERSLGSARTIRLYCASLPIQHHQAPSTLAHHSPPSTAFDGRSLVTGTAAIVVTSRTCRL